MSDEQGDGLFNPTNGEDGSGVPSISTEAPLQPAEGNGEESPQPQFVTEETFNKRLEEFERRVQSSRDSALSSFDKRIKQKIENVEKDIAVWRKQGVNITPAQEQQRRLDAIQEAMLENPDAVPPPQQPVNARQEGPDEAVVKEVNARAMQLSQQAGIELEQGDPELLLLDQSSPDAFLSSFRNAIYQKKLRSGEAGPPPQARIPSMGQQSKSTPGANEQFIKEYQAAAGKGLSYAREIRSKWADKGVDVNALIAENFKD